MAPVFSADSPELRLLAQLAGIAPTRMAAAFSDPEQMLKHISADELQRLVESSERLQGFVLELGAAFKIAEDAYKGKGGARGKRGPAGIRSRTS